VARAAWLAATGLGVAASTDPGGVAESADVTREPLVELDVVFLQEVEILLSKRS
jgi:hypothetical protein